MKSIRFRRFISMLIFLSFYSVSYCQTAYYRSINGQSKLAGYQIYLQVNQGKLSGNLYYKLLNTNYFQRIEFTGSIDNDYVFTFRKFTEERDFAKGSIKKNAFQGVFELTDSLTDTLSISDIISFNENQFQLFSTNKTVKLLPSEDSPEATFEMSVLVPEFNQSSSLRESVLKFLNIFPDSIPVKMIDIQQQLIIEQNNFLNDYLKLRAFKDNDILSFNWFKTSTVQMLYLNPNIFCLENTIYAYNGGIHDIENNSFGIFNYLSNKQLTKNDIFNPDTDSILTGMITKAIKQSQQINQDSILPDYLYFVEQVNPNNNIYLTPAGLGFYYNSYEIAPYSTGQTNIFFRFDELNGLLNEGFKKMISDSE